MKLGTPLPHHACLDPAAGDKNGGGDCITNRTGSSSARWWCKSLSSWLYQMQIVSMLWVITQQQHLQLPHLSSKQNKDHLGFIQGKARQSKARGFNIWAIRENSLLWISIFGPSFKHTMKITDKVGLAQKPKSKWERQFAEISIL